VTDNNDRSLVAFELGKAQWPAIRSLTLAAFQAFVNDAVVEPDALADRAGDLYLAAAATAGDANAVELFDSQVLSALPRWLARLHLAPDVIDEVRQQLRAKLLVGSPPKLGQYRANGPLAAWVRVVAVRAALDMCGGNPVLGDQTYAPDDQPLLKALDPEQQLIRHKYGALFETALREALAELSKRDRNLLRFHYLSRMNLDAIARTYKVHRATAVRWLAAIRTELDNAVRVRLWQELGVSPSEFRSLWNAVGSDVEVSLSRLLAAD
jgi:RNA polymerase sigma-70 factor (ECF subfamily)